MSVKLNLLPPEHLSTGPFGKVLKTIRALNIVLLALFMFFILGLTLFFIFSRSQLSVLAKDIDEFKRQISNVEESEQQAVLLKDRIGKIQTLQSLVSSSKNLGKIDPFVSAIGNSSSLDELDIDSQKIDLSVVFKSNSDLSAFLKSLVDSKVFSSVSISSFSYNPASGYLVTFHIL